MIVLLILIVLGGLRFYELGLKPAHHDESINGFFVHQIWQNGWFQYDPSNYHGPLLFYLFAFAERCFGWGVESFRIVTVSFSVAQLLVLWAYFRRRAPGGLWQLLPLLVSPGFMFFARSGIHESVFVFFMTLFLLGSVEILDASLASKSTAGRWPLPALIWGLWGCLVVKETWILLVVAGVLAYAVVWRLNDLEFNLRKIAAQLRGAAGHLVAALVSLVLLFTGFWQRPRGMIDFFTAFLPWTKTGMDQAGHSKAITYWAEITARHEVPLALFLAVIFIFGALNFKRLKAGTQWLFLTAFLHFLFFSIIPYKTPWCVISILMPCAMAGMSVWSDLSHRGFPFRRSLALLILVLSVVELGPMWELNFVNPTPLGHEYVYVQTDQRMGRLTNYLYAQVKKNPPLREAKFQIGGDETWPMAWTFSGFSTLIFQSVSLGVLDQVDFLMANAEEASIVEQKIAVDDFWTDIFPIRDGRVPSKFYLRKSRFPESPFLGGQNGHP